MKIFMVGYKHKKHAVKAVEAKDEIEAKRSFQEWRNKRNDKEQISEALCAYELDAIW